MAAFAWPCQRDLASSLVSHIFGFALVFVYYLDTLATPSDRLVLVISWLPLFTSMRLTN